MWWEGVVGVVVRKGREGSSYCVERFCLVCMFATLTAAGVSGGLGRGGVGHDVVW